MSVKVRVGSRNPAKLAGVKAAFERFFQQGVEVIPVKVDSGVPDQPYGEQAMEGAVNRARRAWGDCDFSVGVEAGLFELGRTFVANWICIFDGKREYLGMSPWFELDARLAQAIREHREMEEVMERELGVKGIGDRMGAVGVFTRGAMDRAKFTEAGVLAALAGWEQACRRGP